MSHPVVDDKSQVCLDFILEQLKQQALKQERSGIDPVLIVGLNGVQGCGKTTLVSTVAEKLRQPPHSLPTVVFSIDDLYLPRNEQAELASKHPGNPLVQHRGQPSTHDIGLGLSLLSTLQTGQLSKIPAYDKGAFNGLGDRVAEEHWATVNQQGQPAVRVVIFEGWCVGFRALTRTELRGKWDSAVAQMLCGGYQGQLGNTKFEDVEYVNDALKSYDRLTDQFRAFIYIDAEETKWAYEWRLEQEAALRKSSGNGMTDEQVVRFVDGYYPAYELFTNNLRAGSSQRGWEAQLRLVIGQDRRLKQILYT